MGDFAGKIICHHEVGTKFLKPAIDMLTFVLGHTFLKSWQFSKKKAFAIIQASTSHFIFPDKGVIQTWVCGHLFLLYFSTVRTVPRNSGHCQGTWWLVSWDLMWPIGGELVTTITPPSCWVTHFLYLSNPPSGNLLPMIPWCWYWFLGLGGREVWSLENDVHSFAVQYNVWLIKYWVSVSVGIKGKVHKFNFKL